MKSPPPKNSWTFQKIVTQPTQVRSAFGEFATTRHWWAAVLWMHGKRAPGVATLDESTNCVASGFRFYGWLYAFVGAMHLMTSIAAMSIGAVYWAAGAAAMGAFLFVAGRVGMIGAAQFQKSPTRGVPMLALFLGMITIFLAMFLSTTSIVVNETEIAPALVNIGILSILVVFGIGSYAIELLYLFHIAFTHNWAPRAAT